MERDFDDTDEEWGEPVVIESSKNVRFPEIIPVRVSFDMKAELETIVMYEHKAGTSPLIRDWITEKLKKYERNPHYLRFKKQMDKE